MYRVAYLAAAATVLIGCATSPPASDDSVPAGVETTERARSDSTDDTVANTEVDPAAPVNPEPGITMPPGGSQVVCVRERRTGSNRAKKVCRTRAQIEEERVRSKETFEGLRRSQEHIEQ